MKSRAIISVLLFVSCLSCMAQKEIILSGKEKVKIERTLHPLPQEPAFSGKAYVFSPNDCSVKLYKGALPLEKQFLKDFQKRWMKRFGSPLSNAEENAKLNIIISKLSEKTKSSDLLDEYLKSRPNKEQAYAILCEKNEKGLTIRLVANDSPGIFYSIVTLEQLLKGLSSSQEIVMPFVKIIDWPDLKERAQSMADFSSWQVLALRGRDFYENILYKYASMKGNIHYTEIRLKDENGKPKIMTLPLKSIAIAKNYNVSMIPRFVHIGHYLAGKFKKTTPEIININSIKHDSLCYSQAKTQELIDEIFRQIISQAGYPSQMERFSIWLTESEGKEVACHCDKCEGNLKKQFTNEVNCLLKAYKKAIKGNSKPALNLLLTQGSYPHNLEIFQNIPKNVEIDYYNGMKTYRFDPEFLIPPSIRELKRKGYNVGVMPLITLIDPHVVYTMPFKTPLLIKERVSEIVNVGLQRAFMWSGFQFDAFNIQAAAEYAWNVSGRTPHEFAASWAQRHGLPDPDLAADIIIMQEYPELAIAISAGSRAFSRRLIKYMAKILSGKSNKNFENETLTGFEYKTPLELKILLKNCEEAEKQAENNKFPETFILEAKILKSWMKIIERFVLIINEKRDVEARKEALQSIVEQTCILETDWKKLYQMTKPAAPRAGGIGIQKRKIPIILEEFEKNIKTLKNLDPRKLLDPEWATLDIDTKYLEEASKNESLVILPLTNWRFKTDPQNLSNKLLSDNINGWADIKSAGKGWESQGYPEYNGWAWYAKFMDFPEALLKKKHCIIFFEAVDEDAVVYLNNSRIGAHTCKSTHMTPEEIWNKPFVLHINKKLLRMGSNKLAVRVLNRSGMGGIWKPAYIIGADKKLCLESLKRFFKNKEKNKIKN